MGIGTYKEVQQNTESVADQNVHFLESLKVWMMEAQDERRSEVDRKKALGNASVIANMFIEYMNADLPEEEFESLYIIFVKISDEINKAIKNEVHDFSQGYRAINFLLETMRGD